MWLVAGSNAWGVFKQKLCCLRIIPCAVGLQIVWATHPNQLRYGFGNIKGLLCWQPAAQLMVHAVCWSELLEISDQLSGMQTLVIRGLSFWHPSCTFSYYKITALIIFQTLCKPLVYINCLSQSIVSDIILRILISTFTARRVRSLPSIEIVEQFPWLAQNVNICAAKRCNHQRAPVLCWLVSSPNHGSYALQRNAKKMVFAGFQPLQACTSL